MDGISSGDSSAYEALERLKQDLFAGLNSRKAGARPEELLADKLRLKIENERLREELEKRRPLT